MPLVSYEFPRVPGGRDLITRSFAISMPIDWYTFAATGPLPVILLLHGGNQTALEFMDNLVEARRLWDGSHYLPVSQGLGMAGGLGDLIKAIVVAPQGVSIDGEGGDWNSGHMSIAARTARVDDVAFIFDALERADRGLVEHFNSEYGPQMGGLSVLEVLDRARVMIIGFSNGGEMAYRIAWESKNVAWGWTVTAMGVVCSTIGGWNSFLSYTNGDPALADWTPLVGLFQFVSVLHIQRINDQRIPFEHPMGLDRTEPVIAGDVLLQVANQLGAGPNPADYARADFTGVGTYLKLFDVADADYAGTLLAGTPLAVALPVSVAAPIAHEWTDAAGAQLALHFYPEDVPAPVAHTYPHFIDLNLGLHATTHFVDFFQRFGGL